MDLITLSNGGKSGELLIYEAIGETWLSAGVTARHVHRALKDAGDKLEELTIRINSPGGSVVDGNAIYNELARHTARKIVEVDALAASAASVVMMAGDEIRMAKNALVMIHEAWGMTQGDATEHEKTAALLRKMSDGAADIYAARTGNEKAVLLEMMAQETWLTADEALALKFCTQVHAAKEPPKASWASKVPQAFRKAPPAYSSLLSRMSREERPAQQPIAKPALVPTALGQLATERSRACLGDL